jgi:mannose-6-phosphate isomerase class I
MDLSVQGHPNDSYSMKNENEELGKTECWYIFDCKGSYLILPMGMRDFEIDGECELIVPHA